MAPSGLAGKDGAVGLGSSSGGSGRQRDPEVEMDKKAKTPKKPKQPKTGDKKK
jgi:hypothetical protein